MNMKFLNESPADSAMMYADSGDEALRERKRFADAFRDNPNAVGSVVENWDRLT